MPPRPYRFRRVRREPDVDYFKPAGVGISETGIIELGVDEFEAVRLHDFEKKTQQESAEKMGISQPTFHRILENGHGKIAEAIVKGLAIKIKGGRYMTNNTGKKGVPKKDGSGKGKRMNKGRSGCKPPKDKGIKKENKK
ncbi:MAG: DUF134 domain-containing protein [Candidatus Undinarchaeales archaeon]